MSGRDPTGGVDTLGDAVRFDELVYRLGSGVADAQARLDRSLGERVREYGESTVAVPPRVTRRIGADGTVETSVDPPVERSLLAFGLTPTRYQFSEATVDAEFDVRTTTETETEREVSGETRTGLFAATGDLREYRKFGRDVAGTARLSATLVPTPLPPAVDVETRSQSEE